MNYGEIDKLLNAMRDLFYLGLINPRGGNGSVKISDNLVAVTPSGLGKQWLRPSDIVIVSIDDGRVVKGKHRPTVEVNAHLLIYKRVKEAGSVLHAHPPLSLALTDHGLADWWRQPLVEVTYSLGAVEVVREAPPGSLELAELVSEAMGKGARLVIVPRHGAFAWGRSVEEALDAIVALETTAKYYLARRAIGSLLGL